MTKKFKQNSRRWALAALTTTALAAGLAHAQSTTPAAAAQPQATAPNAPQLTIRDVYDRVEQAGYQDMREIEFDDGRYEVKARDAQGQRVKLYVNARTGEVEHSKFKD